MRIISCIEPVSLASFSTEKDCVAFNMAKLRELTNEERRQIVALRDEGIPVGRVAMRFRCCRQTVSRICRRHRNTGDANKLHRSGRPKKTTAREDRRLFRITRLWRFNPGTILAALWCQDIGRNLCTNTVRGRLKGRGLRARVARRKPLITLVNRRRRVAWATRVRNWTVAENWRHAYCFF